ncbi:MAG: DUF4249 domain-containing protein [Bacteroidota bacterium]
MRTFKYIFLILALLPLTGCIEEIGFENENFESALVVEAMITNEEKHHQINLSRTYRFEEDESERIEGAVLTLFEDNGTYDFEEVEPGIYVSSEIFKADANKDYRLEISTNGNTYLSTTKQLTSPTEIDRLYVERETNDDNVNGLSIYVDTFDPAGNSKYYRYEYEETFRVEPPFFVPEDLVLDLSPGDVNDPCPDCVVKMVPRSPDKRVCYRTETSQSIILTSSNSFNEDRVSRFLTRFVKSDDYRISHRYSILVKQFVHSPEVYNYLEALSSFSSEGSLFSQLQPGSVTGNITSEENPNETVLGYFEVASVSRKRIFFNYDDFYPNEPLPPYLNNCIPRAPFRCRATSNNSFRCAGLVAGIKANTIVYKEPNNGQLPLGGRYLILDRECGDCTALGESEPPEFWIE